MKGRALIAVMLLVSMIALGTLALPTPLQTTTDAAAYGGISIQLDRPSFAGKSEKIVCTLTITGGPAEEMTGPRGYSFEAEIIAENETGSSLNPTSGSSPDGVFKLNVTMPAFAPQVIKILINATSEGGVPKAVKHLEQEFEIKVVDPIVISATVFNIGDVDARNVTAKFYADGIFLTSKVFNVSAGSSTKLTYNWTFDRISSGRHVITVVVDDPNNLVEFNEGNNAYSLTIYVGDQGNPVGAVLTVAVIIMSVFVGLMWLQKPQRRGKKF